MSSWAHQKLAWHRVKPASTVALLLFLAASDPAGISDFHCEWLLRINHVFTLPFPHPGLIKVQQVIHSQASKPCNTLREWNIPAAHAHYFPTEWWFPYPPLRICCLLSRHSPFTAAITTCTEVHKPQRGRSHAEGSMWFQTLLKQFCSLLHIYIYFSERLKDSNRMWNPHQWISKTKWVVGFAVNSASDNLRCRLSFRSSFRLFLKSVGSLPRSVTLIGSEPGSPYLQVFTSGPFPGCTIYHMRNDTFLVISVVGWLGTIRGMT